MLLVSVEAAFGAVVGLLPDMGAWVVADMASLVGATEVIVEAGRSVGNSVLTVLVVGATVGATVETGTVGAEEITVVGDGVGALVVATGDSKPSSPSSSSLVGGRLTGPVKGSKQYKSLVGLPLRSGSNKTAKSEA